MTDPSGNFPTWVVVLTSGGIGSGIMLALRGVIRAWSKRAVTGAEAFKVGAQGEAVLGEAWQHYAHQINQDLVQFRTDLNKLQSLYNTLHLEHSALKIKHEVLQKDYDALTRSRDILQRDYEVLRSRVENHGKPPAGGQ